MSKNNPHPLFTLTAEEAEVIRRALFKACWFEKDYIEYYEKELAEESIQQCRNEIKKFENILTRIKQWQNE